MLISLLHNNVATPSKSLLLGFVQETEYVDGGLAAGTQFIANPHLFAAAGDVEATIAAWPLQPATVLNFN